MTPRTATEVPTDILSELERPYPLTDEQIAFFRDNGFIHLKSVLPSDCVRFYEAEIAAKVGELSDEKLPLDQRTTYGKAFLQVMNLWRSSAVVRAFVFNRRMARIAAELMGCEGVRLYHDQALFKEPGGGITPWHADQYYWPLSNDRTVTAWTPLVEVGLPMGPLSFCPGSQRIHDGRNLGISDESEEAIGRALARYGIVEEPFDLGDVSFHSGWTFHRAGANNTARMREVFTIIYMDEQIRLSEPKNRNQEIDWERWCPGVRVGEVVNSELNPVLYAVRD